MADTPLVWEDLAKYKAEGRFLDGYPDDQRTFFAPRDNVHGLLVALLDSAQHSIVVNMFGYDDDELNKIIQGKLADEKIYVQMSLDRSQSTGAHEKQILASWANDAFGNSIAIGTSSVHNAISHLKIVIVDGVYTVKGSTNWSLSGEQQQDNELTLSRNAVVAAETRAILDLNHDFMLKQMVGTKLDVTKLQAPATSAAMPPLPPAPASAAPPQSSPGSVLERSYRVRVGGKLVGLIPGFGRAGIGFDDRRVRNDIDAQDQLVSCVFPRSQNRLRSGI
jgi:phosphatidylserine/phosphatidylglycerophosphate/cardiolipin synthase-like enzyme